MVGVNVASGVEVEAGVDVSVGGAGVDVGAMTWDGKLQANMARNKNEIAKRFLLI